MYIFKKLVGGIILLLIFLIICVLILGQAKTLRYPRLTFDPAPQAQDIMIGTFEAEAEGAYVKSKQNRLFRAFSPSVTLMLRNLPEQGETITIENIHPDAILETDSITAIKRGHITEVVNGLTRQVKISAPGSRVGLIWRFPEQQSYRFGVLGDTGGDRELEWGLQRLAGLDVDFILHLGDLYYHLSELGKVHERFNRSKVPVYATIGNHDFHGSKGNTHRVFSQNIGPLNSAFQLLDSCFINIDTAADMYPADKGHRATFLAGLSVQSKPPLSRCEKIVFTHKPFTDGLKPETIPNQGHSLDGYQADGLRKWFSEVGNITLLSGHIHDDFEFALPGIKTYVAGSGLAVKDLTMGKPVAKYLLGQISQGENAEFMWVPGNMPLNYHCSKKIRESFESEGSKWAARLDQACK